MAKNLYQRLLDITEEIGKIEKTGKNQMQGYSFIEQAKVVAELRPLLKKHGVFIVPETVSKSLERFENKKGTITVHANVTSRYTVVNADEPSEKFVSEWDGGEAMDTSDKATNKATTASHKYFLMKLFNISDKDDADTESPELPSSVPATRPGSKVITDKQLKWLLDEAAKKAGQGADEYQWLWNLLTIDPVKIPIFKFQDALNKVKEQPDPSTKLDVVSVDIEGEINLDGIPY